MTNETGSERDCLSGAPRRRRWTGLAIPVVAAGLVFGAVAVAQTHPHEEIDPDNQDHYARLLSEVKQDEEQARAEIADAAAEDSEDARADKLVKLANRHRLAGESTRQAYVKVARTLDDAQRSRVLRKLLAAAPITTEAGRAVLEAASESDSDAEILRVLMYFHEIKESDLVRGPLTAMYLDVVEKLDSSEAVGEALRGLLHPSELEPSQVVRALALAGKLERDEDRLKVLREVTDHQFLSSEVVEAYRQVDGKLTTTAARDTSRDRFEAARDGADDYRRHPRRKDGPKDFAFRFELDDDTRSLKAQLDEVKAKMKALRKQMKRDLGEDIDLDGFDVQID